MRATAAMHPTPTLKRAAVALLGAGAPGGVCTAHYTSCTVAASTKCRDRQGSGQCAGESERVRQVNARDPVRHVKLGAWCKQCLHKALEVHGAALQARISALPQVVSDSLQQMVK